MVNTAVEGVTSPIEVPFNVPPKIVTLLDVRFNAVKFVEDAVAANKFVEVEPVNTALTAAKSVTVAFEKTTFVMVALLEFTLTNNAFTEAKLVEVALVVVLFKIVAVPVTFKLVVTKFPVEVPPPKVMVVVAVFPWFKTC